MLDHPVCRRTLLRGAAVGAAALLLDLRHLCARPAEAARPDTGRSYRRWEDVHRARWTWDRIAVGTHANANCTGTCAWNLYVRDQIVWHEEQSAPYTASNETVADWNPRGCQKGASCSQLMLGPSRLRYPLRRVGERGAGRWKRIPWDEALDEVARELVDTLVRRGGDGVLCEFGTNFGYGPDFAGLVRFFRQIGGMITDNQGQVGDGPVGATITLGFPRPGGSSDGWFQSDHLVLWALNPAVTRTPDAHFLAEARYRGARIVTIAPDHNPSAIHADLWLSPRPGTDAALALAACRVILEEHLYEADYLREQTDLPFLVRSDTHRFLRESDLRADGRADCFACWDETAKALVRAPGTAGSSRRTLRFAPDEHPALDARARVRLASGREVTVRTVFSLLEERLARFDPETCARITGIRPGTILRFARDFAAAPSALILAGQGGSKLYHGDLVQRSQILLASLTGNLGRPGGGWQMHGFLAMTGAFLVAGLDRLGALDLALLALRARINPEAVAEQMSALGSTFVSGALLHTLHGELREEQTDPAYGDPGLPRSPDAYLTQALARGDIRVGPPPGAEPPEVLLSIFGNVLRQSRMCDRVRDTLFARARLIVDVGIRMSETARHADLLLPAAGAYEKLGLKITLCYVPYLTLADRAVPPVGESKPEWEIFSLLAERVGAEARRRGVTEVRGYGGRRCDIAQLGQRFSDNGRLGPGDAEKVLRSILHLSGPSPGITLEDLRQGGGAIRFRGIGDDDAGQGLHSEYRRDEPLVPMRDFTEKKKPYPTLTGRQQFYIDAPWFLEVGEELPVHKEPPAAGGSHPFTLTCGHTRWSIHSLWRDQDLMLRLQRGEPVVYLNPSDAQEAGIRDHDVVRIWNDLGGFVAHAKPTGAMHPGQIHIDHAWEPYQFRSGTSDQHVRPSPIKVTQLVGDYGHVHWGPGYYEPNQNDRDTRVSLTKIRARPTGSGRGYPAGDRVRPPGS